MLVSIIMPFFNSQNYLEQAISSVVNQTYKNWELLLINDGSDDNSRRIALSFQDKRIKYFEQQNRGVSEARNLGLNHMDGIFFCFLDADDVFPPNSISSRLEEFRMDPTLDFVDGTVLKMDERLMITNEIWTPNFSGNPLNDLVKMTGNSFFGPSWLIKRNKAQNYKFQTGLSHAEDLLFYLHLSKEGGNYGSTEEVILHYRDSGESAMKNLDGLEKGYRFVESQLKKWNDVSKLNICLFGYRFRKSMFLSYLNKNQLIKAFKAIL